MNNQGPLLGQRTVVILLLGTLAATAAGVLTVLAGSPPATGFLAAGAAFIASVSFFHTVME